MAGSRGHRLENSARATPLKSRLLRSETFFPSITYSMLLSPVLSLITALLRPCKCIARHRDQPGPVICLINEFAWITTLLNDFPQLSILMPYVCAPTMLFGMRKV